MKKSYSVFGRRMFPFFFWAISFYVASSFFSASAWALRAIPEDNLKYPALVVLEDGSTASGFYVNKNDEALYFVTAKHVLFNEPSPDAPDRSGLKNKKAIAHSYPKGEGYNEPIQIGFDLDYLRKRGYIRLHKEKDVALIKIGDTEKVENSFITHFVRGVKRRTRTEEERRKGIVAVALSDMKRYDDVLLSNDVFIFGYPTSLGIKNEPQIDYREPLLRKGIVAGKNDLRKTIILDCPAYYGNSGGPVLEVEWAKDLSGIEYRVIGMVSEYIPFEETWYTKRRKVVGKDRENSGYSVAVPMDAVLELIDQEQKSRKKA